MEERKNRQKIFVLFCLIFFATLLFRGSTFPFVGVNSWNFNTYTLIAHNYNKFGFTDTYFAPVVSVAQKLPENPDYYLHHPQLLSVAQALFFKIFGESFFTARLPVIFACIISLFLIYKIAVSIKGEKYGLLCLALGTVLPGFVVFGKMIGQEALVLMFVLSITYFTLLFKNTSRMMYFYLALLSAVLGSLSDWPVAYFILFFGLYAYNGSTKKLYGYLFVTTVTTFLVFLTYVAFFSRGFGDLSTAFLVRGPGEVLLNPFWYGLWPLTILLRILVYTGPFVLLAGCIGIVFAFKERFYDINRFLRFIIVFLLFGMMHILLYPEGSFGHAYWIFYTVPFFIFSAGFFLLKLQKKHFVILAFFLAAGVYSLLVIHWKTSEARGNIFRYNFAQVVSGYFPKYSAVGLNPGSAIDPDLLGYAFSLNAYRLNTGNLGKSMLYTCSNSCTAEDLKIVELLRRGQVTTVESAEIKGFITSGKASGFPEHIDIEYDKQPGRESIFKKFYVFAMDRLKFPQL